MLYAQLHLTLPPWIHDQVDADAVYQTTENRIALAVKLSQLNVSHQSGGPFGAAVFNKVGRLLGVGVNRVVPHNCSAAHAEVMALHAAPAVGEADGPVMESVSGRQIPHGSGGYRHRT